MTEGGNETRGEVTVQLGGETFGLRPSWEAIQTFEAATGKGVLQLAREADAAALTSSEVAQITCACMRAWGVENGVEGAARANPRKVAQLIQEAEGGFVVALGTIRAVLIAAATGGYTASGEVKAATTKTATPAAA